MEGGLIIGAEAPLPNNQQAPAELPEADVAAMANAVVPTAEHPDIKGYAGDFEQARAKCDGLSRMSKEDALKVWGMRDVMAEFIDRGREDRLAEETKAEHNNKIKSLDNETINADVLQKAEVDINMQQVLMAEFARQQSVSRQIESIEEEAAVQSKTNVIEARTFLKKEVRSPLATEENKEPATIKSAPHIEQPEVATVTLAFEPLEERVEVLADTLTEQVKSTLLVEAAESVIQPQSFDEPTPQIVSAEEDFILVEDDVGLAIGEFEPVSAENDEDFDWQLPVIQVEPIEAELFTNIVPELEDETEAFETDTLELKAEDQTVELSEFSVLPELPAPIEEVEAAMIQLTEVLEAAEADEKSAEVHKILVEIINFQTQLENIDQSQETSEQKLEELFTNLFEAAGIEYTPELIESFVKLTQAHYLEELIEVEPATDEQNLPNEIGTREFLQKLQAAIGRIKRAASNFYQIGKAVLIFYTSGKGLLYET